MTNMADHVPQNDQAIKCSKPDAFYKALCKTEVGPEDLTRITPEPSPSVGAARENM